MDCPSCAHANPRGARFCNGCGAALAPVCPACDAANPAAARFCNQCGRALDDASGSGAGATPSEAPRRPPAGPGEREPRSYTPPHLAETILQGRSALEGERKQVTVLFADVHQSLHLSQGLDPEELHRVMDGFFAILLDGVHRYEGTVNQFTGDGIMALFGAPVAHEDHVHRACFAALHMQQELGRYAGDLRRKRGLGFSVRMGLNTGEVVVGRIGDDLRMDYTARGHTVGLAARMEQLAEPGHIYVGPATAEVARGFFDLRDLGAFDVRGADEPVPVSELRGLGELRTRIERSQARGFARFVGRREELEILDAALDTALDGHGRALAIAAEPGIGKSRLCLEFTARVRSRGLPVRRTHAVPHGRHLPFLPIIGLLRDWFGIAERDDAVAARRKVAGALLLQDPALERVLPAVFDLLGVADESRPGPAGAQIAQAHILDAIRAMLAAEPQVWILEDLHWFDPASEALLAAIVRVLPDTPTLLVANYRPEHSPVWTGEAHARELRMEPLSAEEMRELGDDLLGRDPSLGDLCGRLCRRAAGNPFFLEETVWALADAGRLLGRRGAYRLEAELDRIDVPDTVGALLAARIDRLEERDKRLLQCAAVIGRGFGSDVLERVSDLDADAREAGLRALVAAEFIARTGLPPDAEYTFRHPLIQNVAYDMLLHERRALLHERVGSALEATLRGPAADDAALLAHHWERAQRPERAARWHGEAARWSGRTDPRTALSHWSRARELLGETPKDDDARTLAVHAATRVLDLGWRFEIDPAHAAEAYTRARRLAEALPDPEPLVGLLIARAQLCAWDGPSGRSQSLELSTEAVARAAASADERLRAAAQSQLSRAWWRMRDYRQALEHADAAVRLEPSANAHLRFRGRLRTEMGRLAEARTDLDRALEHARASGDVSERTLTHLCFADHARFVGAFPFAVSHARQAIDLAEGTGDRFSLALGLLNLGDCYIWMSRYDEAIGLLETSAQLGQAQLSEETRAPDSIGLLAEAYLGAGRLEEARETAERGDAADDPDAIQAKLALARVLAAVDGPAAADRIEALLDRADAFVDRSGAEIWRPLVAVERAGVAEARGDAEAARRGLREAHAGFARMGAAGHAQRVAARMDPESVPR